MHPSNPKVLPDSLSRRGLFRALGGARQVEAIRPPWSLPERLFVTACTGCGDCTRACPQGILTLNAGYPETSFANAGCDGCGECATACTDEALDRATQPAWRHTIAIGAACLAEQGIVCRVCAEHCDASAIRFRLAVGGRGGPILNIAACTACGACVGPCPSNAITIITA
ncbi:MAG: ferredoxin-type protein NapF [Rhodospirillaceae bacterium]